LTLVGLFMEGTTFTCLEMYSDAKKRTLLGMCIIAIVMHSSMSNNMRRLLLTCL
jgi:hypothetical protein